ncbi:DUF1801 domain-containing protein [Acidipropionibacterium acidipropionici]|uniref:DUF1801 domain-containing protein n=1 Tax=Acidipropionibacterium acidipropionici TaxID=1748 RepID=UPI0018DBC086|nr:DUF1801 domain-containing protein [Acidipropionibacterium acidipropionici]
MNGKKSGTRQPPITEGAAEAASGRALTLPTAMNGKASPAKAADGDAPVFAYLASLPQPQRDIAEAIDALAARTLPNLHRSVKWGMAYYGVGDGWCFSSGGFAGHVKLMFINGATLLDPVPPGDADRNGQGHPGRRARICGRPRRTTDSDLDETDHLGAGNRRQEELKSPASDRWADAAP